MTKIKLRQKKTILRIHFCEVLIIDMVVNSLIIEIILTSYVLFAACAPGEGI